MNSVMRHMNEMVSKSVKAREMSVKYIVNTPRISFNSADTSLIEETGGNAEIQVFWENRGKLLGNKGRFSPISKVGFPDEVPKDSKVSVLEPLNAQSARGVQSVHLSSLSPPKLQVLGAALILYVMQNNNSKKIFGIKHELWKDIR